MKEQFLTGVTEKTPLNLQLNAGVLLKNFDTETDEVTDTDIIGATRGGGSFSAVPTVHQASADGVPTNYKGLDRIDEWVVTLNATLIETTADSIKRALGCTVKETKGSNYTKYTCGNEISDTDYTDIWWLGAMSNGKKIAIKIKNGMNKSGFTLTFTDKGEGTFPLAIIGNYAYADLKTGEAPFEIYLPNAED